MSLLCLALNQWESARVNTGEFMSHQKNTEILSAPGEAYLHGFNRQTCSMYFHKHRLSGFLFN